MASVLDLVKHYQHSIERYPDDEQKVLKAIDKLFNLDVKVQHLQDTGVGRTVNALRKEPGDVGKAARALVYKWKLMVAAEESDAEDDHNDSSIHNGHGSEKDYDTDGQNAESKNHKENGDSSTSKRKYQSSEEEEPDTKKSRHSYSSDSDNYKNRNIKKESETESYSDDSDSQSDSESDSSEEDSKHIKIKTEPEDKCSSKNSHNSPHHKSESSSSKRSHESEHHSSKHSKLHHSSSNRHNSEKLSKSSHSSKDKSSKEREQTSEKKHRDKSEKDKNKDKEERSIREKEDTARKEKEARALKEKEERLQKEESKSSEKQRSSHKESSSDKHKSQERSKADHDKRKSDKHSSSKSDKEKHKSSSEKDITDKRKSSESSSKEKSSSNKEKSKDGTSSSKEKEKSSSSHSSKSEKKHSSGEKLHRSDKKKSEKSSEKRSSHKSSSEKSKSSSSKSKEDKPKKKVTIHENNEESDQDGIGCESGASFGEALGMVVPTKPKKKQITPTKDPVSPTNLNDLSPAALLAPTAKLAPLPALEISALPEISPNYKPRPPPKFQPHFTDDDAMSMSISSKNQRTKVYSGNKILGKVPTLYEMCVQILQEHIDALEYTGGVPYEILKPVVDKATPQQLFVLEHYNPYLMEDTDHLWQKHCEKHFRNKKRQEMETWREMYMRCQEEQEHKLKSLTANIKMTQEAKKAPIKQTKMAYVDTVVKPPRNIARKQAMHGTAHMATASPAARVAALAAAPNVLRGGVRAPPAAPLPASALNKPKKAPLMAKALQFMRGRKR